MVLVPGVPAGDGLGGTQMVLGHAIAWIGWLCGRPGKSLIAWSGPIWDNPEVCPGGFGLVLMAEAPCQAGSEPGRWSL